MTNIEKNYIHKWANLVFKCFPQLDAQGACNVAFGYHLLCLQQRLTKLPEQLSKKEWKQHHKSMTAELPNLSEAGIQRLLCLVAQANLMTSEMSKQELADLDQDVEDTYEYVRELKAENVNADTVQVLAKDFLESREAKRPKGFK